MSGYQGMKEFTKKLLCVGGYVGIPFGIGFKAVWERFREG